jgi:hypothetical protein
VTTLGRERRFELAHLHTIVENAIFDVASNSDPCVDFLAT